MGEESMKASFPTHTDSSYWVLEADVGDHKPDTIVLIHNDKAYNYVLDKPQEITIKPYNGTLNMNVSNKE
jgi:hypothetical protein